MLQERTNNLRENQKSTINSKVNENYTKKRDLADQIKYEKMEANELANMARQQENMKQAQVKNLIKSQQ